MWSKWGRNRGWGGEARNQAFADAEMPSQGLEFEREFGLRGKEAVGEDGISGGRGAGGVL